MRRLIRSFDRNNDYAIDLQEFHQLVSEENPHFLEINLNVPNEDLLIKLKDLLLFEIENINQLGIISETIRKLRDFNYIELFNILDKDKKEYLSKDDFLNFLNQNGENFKEEDVKKIVFRLFKENENRISLNEFSEIFYPLRIINDEKIEFLKEEKDNGLNNYEEIGEIKENDNPFIIQEINDNIKDNNTIKKTNNEDNFIDVKSEDKILNNENEIKENSIGKKDEIIFNKNNFENENIFDPSKIQNENDNYFTKKTLKIIETYSSTLSPNNNKDKISNLLNKTKISNFSENKEERKINENYITPERKTKIESQKRSEKCKKFDIGYIPDQLSHSPVMRKSAERTKQVKEKDFNLKEIKKISDIEYSLKGSFKTISSNFKYEKENSFIKNEFLSNNNFSKSGREINYNPFFISQEVPNFIDKKSEILSNFFMELIQIDNKNEYNKEILFKNKDITLSEFFNFFDIGRKNSINLKYFQNVLEMFDISVSPYEVKLLFKRFDIDFDGRLE